MTSTELEGTKTAKVNGTTLAYREQGEGEPVVFVHGGFSDYRIWQVQQDAVGQKYRAIAYSCRYHWPNAPAPADAEHSVAEHVDDLQALLAALGDAPAHLVGNSSGGLLCLYLAIRAPELVRSLILLEPFVLPLFMSVPPRPLQLVKLALRHPRTTAAILQFAARGLLPAQAAFRRGDLEAGLQRFSRAVLGRHGVEQMTEARREQAHDNLEVFASQLTAPSGFPSLDSDDVRRLAMPTLLLSGERSPSIMRLFTDHLHELLPRAERVEIRGASHDAQIDNPSAVTDAALQFLARRPSAQSAA